MDMRSQSAQTEGEPKSIASRRRSTREVMEGMAATPTAIASMNPGRRRAAVYAMMSASLGESETEPKLTTESETEPQSSEPSSSQASGTGAYYYELPMEKRERPSVRGEVIAWPDAP